MFTVYNVTYVVGNILEPINLYFYRSFMLLIIEFKLSDTCNRQTDKAFPPKSWRVRNIEVV